MHFYITVILFNLSQLIYECSLNFRKSTKKWKLSTESKNSLVFPKNVSAIRGVFIQGPTSLLGTGTIWPTLYKWDGHGSPPDRGRVPGTFPATFTHFFFNFFSLFRDAPPSVPGHVTWAGPGRAGRGWCPVPRVKFLKLIYSRSPSKTEQDRFFCTKIFWDMVRPLLACPYPVRSQS